MKITEITNVVRHPAMKRKDAFDNLLKSDNEDDIIAFIMDDNNSESRRLALLKRLDLMLGHAQDVYDASDLDDFMNDQGPKPDSGWREELRNKLEKVAAEKPDYNWKKMDYTMSDEDMIQLAKDLKIPPYHLAVVDETEDDETPTGEYEICQRCGGAGCIECEEGLKDITGMHKALNLDDFIGEE